MDDLISRQAAIDALHVYFKDGFSEDKWWNSTHVLAAIEGLPPAQPEPCTGKWIRNGWAITCSECGYDMPYTVRNFCPNCGAKMTEGDVE